MNRIQKRLAYVLAALVAVAGGLKLQQLALDNARLMENVAMLEQQLKTTEEMAMQRQQTLIYLLNNRGADMPVLRPSGFTAEMYEQAWSKLGADGLKGTGKAIAAAEGETGVNGLILAAMAYLESAGGSSLIAVEKNNLFGLGASDVDPYHRAFEFDHKSESVHYTAELLSRSYLSREGRYYQGDSLRAVGRFYATDPRWADKVAAAMALIAGSLVETEH